MEREEVRPRGSDSTDRVSGEAGAVQIRLSHGVEISVGNREIEQNLMIEQLCVSPPVPPAGFPLRSQDAVLQFEVAVGQGVLLPPAGRSEEHTSELQSR